MPLDIIHFPNETFPPAVAENQPVTNENRMTQIPAFAAQLREFIQCHGSGDASRANSATESEFNQLAVSLFNLQFTHNAPYRRFCEARKVVPQTIKSWREIPAMPTAGFKELELTSLPPEQRTHVFHSSGTTEQRPSRHFHSHESLTIYEMSLLAWFEAHFPTKRLLTFLILTPPSDLAPHSSLIHMFGTIQCDFDTGRSACVGKLEKDGAWALDFSKTLEVLQRSMTTNDPLTIMGTAFNFVHLLDHLVETNQQFQLPPGSCVLETGGYKSRSRTMPKPELQALIMKFLGVPAPHIVCEYGMSELSSQAYDAAIGRNEKEPTRPAMDVASPSPWGEGRGEVDRDILKPKSPSETLPCRAGNIIQRIFHFPPWARAQIINPETGREAREGETGLIRVFDLANVYSVMAIQTEDLGVRRSDGFELLGRAAPAETRGCSLMSI